MLNLRFAIGLVYKMVRGQEADGKCVLSVSERLAHVGLPETVVNRQP